MKHITKKNRMARLSFLLLFPFITSIIFLFVTPTNGENTKYAACSTLYTCGKIQKVGYPFWGESRPKYCGIPNFKLSCDDDKNTSLNIFDNLDSELRVQGIHTSSHTMNFSLEKISNYCYLQNFSIMNIINSTLILNSAYNETVSLFYGCDKHCVSNQSNHHYYKSFICSIYGDGTKGTGYYFGQSSKGRRIGEDCSCKNNITVPVDEKVLDELRSTNASVVDILTRRPIETNYKVNFIDHCVKCEHSGGRCGSSGDPSSDQFVCYCEDGPSPLVCHTTEEKKLKLILGLGIGGVVAVLVALTVICHSRRLTLKFSNLWERREKEYKNFDALLKIYGSLATKRYTYTSIQKITNNFSEKLGEGGYAIVYKGKLYNGRLVAVKLLKQSKGTGEDFVNEVASLDRTNHVNIVPLLGFCFEGKRRALIYDFMSNGSLEKFAYHGATEQALPWETLYSIAVGIARGLEYLHRGCNARILHLDIKPHNILLDENFCPKISDFGLARLCPQQESTISMLEARGTIGYIAPEVIYRTIGGVSHKSDVYSYGMMILDIVCGRKNLISADMQRSSELYFPQWIYNRLQHGEEVAIRGIMNDEKKAIERKMILVSLWCIQTFPSSRPSMSRVIEMLQGDLELIQLPPKARMDYNSSETISLSQ